MKADCSGKFKVGKKNYECDKTKLCLRFSVYPKHRKRIYLSETKECQHFKNVRDYIYST